jgi:REP element-mobilizing transposase RayT
LKGYDYSQPGAYFVTIVTQGRAAVFGAVADGVMRLNPAGEMGHAAWARLPARFPAIALDEFIVMPNHVHGIVWLRDDVGDGLARPEGGENRNLGRDKPGPYHRVALPDVIRVFKSLTTREYRQRFGGGHLWQRGYHDRVIRTEQELDDTRIYIRFNARKWAEDPENR